MDHRQRITGNGSLITNRLPLFSFINDSFGPEGGPFKGAEGDELDSRGDAALLLQPFLQERGDFCNMLFVEAFDDERAEIGSRVWIGTQLY